MGLFDGWKMPDIGQGVEEFRATPGAVLLDVRSRQEFQKGHIPGSRNVPLVLPRGGRRAWRRTRRPRCSSTVTAGPEAARRSMCCGAWGMPT